LYPHPNIADMISVRANIVVSQSLVLVPLPVPQQAV
jgi:hypothetical protein